MKKLKNIFIIIINIIMIISSLSACKEPAFAYSIFADISECQNFENDEAEIIEYTIQDDENLNDLQVEKFYGIKYISSDYEFEIFAYEFKDSDDAKKYFKNVTGKNSDRNTNFSVSRGLKYRLVVIDEEREYLINSTVSDSYAVEEFLAEMFSLKLDF